MVIDSQIHLSQHKITYSYLNQRKCIENLHSQPMHLRQDFGKYKTQKVMNLIVTK